MKVLIFIYNKFELKVSLLSLKDKKARRDEEMMRKNWKSEVGEKVGRDEVKLKERWGKDVKDERKLKERWILN